MVFYNNIYTFHKWEPEYKLSSRYPSSFELFPKTEPDSADLSAAKQNVSMLARLQLIDLDLVFSELHNSAAGKQ